MVSRYQLQVLALSALNQEKEMSSRSRGLLRRLRRIVPRIGKPQKFTYAGVATLFTLLVLEFIFGVPLLDPARKTICGTPVVVVQNSHDQMVLDEKPRPLVVVAAGLPRTGSTWVFNILRILLRMRDPNTVAGWYADLIAIWKNHKTHKYDNMKESWLEAYQSLGTSLLIKTHGPGAFRSFSRGLPLSSVHLTVLTHRDLRTEVRSWVYQNWNSSIHAGHIGDTPFADSSQWVHVAHRILDERNSTLASIGKGSYLDIRYEDWSQKGDDAQLHIVRAIADRLEWPFTDEELLAAIFEVKRIIPPADGARLMYNPISKLHPGHTRIDTKEPKFLDALKAGFEAIEQDPLCSDFLVKQGYL